MVTLLVTTRGFAITAMWMEIYKKEYKRITKKAPTLRKGLSHFINIFINRNKILHNNYAHNKTKSLFAMPFTFGKWSVINYHIIVLIYTTLLMMTVSFNSV